MKRVEAARRATNQLRKNKAGNLSDKDLEAKFEELAKKSGVPEPHLRRIANQRLKKEENEAKVSKAGLQKVDAASLQFTLANRELAQPSPEKVGPFSIREEAVVDDEGDLLVSGLPPGARMLVITIPSEESQTSVTVMPDALIANGMRRRTLNVSATFLQSDKESETKPTPSPTKRAEKKVAKKAPVKREAPEAPDASKEEEKEKSEG